MLCFFVISKKYVQDKDWKGKDWLKNSLDIWIMFESLCCRGPLEKLLKSGVDNLERLYKKVFTVTFGTRY